MASRLNRLAGAIGGASGAFVGELRRAAGDFPSPDALGKRPGVTTDRQGKGDEPVPKAKFLDELTQLSALGYRDRSRGCPYEQIRDTIELMPVLAVIIMTRVNQVMQFGQPSHSSWDTGFRIGLRDKKKVLTKAGRKEARRITKFVQRCGVKGDEPRDSFVAYLAKVTQDTLTFGQDNTEIVPDKLGLPAAFYAVDASTMRLAEPHDRNRFTVDDDEARYLQVLDGIPKVGFRENEMIFGIRNPTTDIRFNGYGRGEVEQVMRACAALIETWNFNSRQFSQGFNVRGLLNLRGMPDTALESFRVKFFQWVRGAENAHTVPVTNAPQGLEFQDFSRAPKDMEMSSWWDLQVRIVAAAFAMSPDEINFNLSPPGITSTLSTPSNRDKITQSSERGIPPLLTHHSSNLNHWIIRRLNPDFELEFVGLDAMTRQQMEEYNAARVRTTHTVNEIRAEQDLPPLKFGDMLLDAGYQQAMVQAQQQQLMARAQAAQAAAGGDSDPFGNPVDAVPGDGQVPDRQGQGGGQGDEGEPLYQSRSGRRSLPTGRWFVRI